jgi:hypothetical protein
MRSLDDQTILTALAKLGQRLTSTRPIEILIVGGAAGVLIKALPAAWTTADVDAIHFRLPQDRDLVLDTAAVVGRELSLPADWLNDWSTLYAWTLPDDWKARRVPVGTFGMLEVFAASRFDLIAMKFIAHRPGDLEHLERMNVTAQDLEFVDTYLDTMARAYPAGRYPTEAGKIAMAREYLKGWELKP